MTIENDPIKHVVLLILQNHSFGQLLGCFKEPDPGLVGVDPNKLRSNKEDQGNLLNSFFLLSIKEIYPIRVYGSLSKDNSWRRAGVR